MMRLKAISEEEKEEETRIGEEQEERGASSDDEQDVTMWRLIEEIACLQPAGLDSSVLLHTYQQGPSPHFPPSHPTHSSTSSTSTSTSSSS